MRRNIWYFLLLWGVASASPVANSAIADEPPTAARVGPPPMSADGDAFRSRVLPFLSKYCASCHGAKRPQAGLNLDSLQDASTIRSQRRPWRRILEYVDGGIMPPEDHAQPGRAEAEAVTAWIRAALDRDSCDGPSNPGRVTIRRLNRAEYNNTVRDLVGVDLRPADEFPYDDVGYGFDNVGDVLSLPPVLMERYLAAAEMISRQVIVGGPAASGQVRTWDGATFPPGSGGQPHGPARLLDSEGEISVKQALPQDALYEIRVRATGNQAGSEFVRMAIRVDGRDLGRFDVAGDEDDGFEEFRVRARLSGGTRRISVAYLNDFFEPETISAPERDRNLLVQSIQIEGPLREPGEPLPESHRRILFREPKSQGDYPEAARAILERFASRAYRRPVAQQELDRLVGLVELALSEGESFERGIQLAVQAVLASPHFLFRVELDSRPRTPAGPARPAAGSEPIGEFELASRVSYFLWSTMPDEELYRLAREGKLRSPGVLAGQVRRMIADPRSAAFVENFGGQWLQIRNLKSASPDRDRFPGFDEALREAMFRETELFFAEILREDRSILCFLDADFTYLNERLARHYGIGGVTGDEFRRVVLTGPERGGLLTQASVLTVTSNPNRTSPVKRGRWVLEQLLGAPPPPPPPDVKPLKEDRAIETTLSMRRRMEQHRAQASCAVCHNRLDPLGFGLENYDGLGAWRSRDGDSEIDASGTLPSGESFQGPGGLKAVLKSRSRDFARCLTEKMLTYALGRGLEADDRCAVERIVKDLEANQYRFSALVQGIVASDPFTKRRY